MATQAAGSEAQLVGAGALKAEVASTAAAGMEAEAVEEVSWEEVERLV